ncbi:SGNH/GDSL hydrolase family protein [Acidobacteriota bacterium]
MKKTLFRITAIVLALLVGLTVFEVSTRIVRSRTPQKRSTAVPSNSFWPKNTLGFRDRNYRIGKPTGFFRIAVIGDSFTWGHGVTAWDTYPKRMERALAGFNRSLQIEVPNCSQRGWNTVAELRALEKDVLLLEPDVVVVGFCLNDPEPSNPQDRDALLAEVKRHMPSSKLGANLYKWSSFYRFSFDRIENTRQRRAFLSYYQKLYDDDYSGWQACVEALSGMQERLSAQDIRFSVVIFPVFDSPLKETYPYRALHDKIMDICAFRGIPCLDLLPFYEGIDPSRLTVVPFTDPHPSEIAHRIASDAIIGFLKAEGLLPEMQKKEPAVRPEPAPMP